MGENDQKTNVDKEFDASLDIKSDKTAVIKGGWYVMIPVVVLVILGLKEVADILQKLHLWW